IGIIERVDREDGSVKVRYDDKTVTYTMENLDEIEPAYAITVHKSQGSEYPFVVIPVAAFSPMLMTRNLIYTAVTRAKEMVILVGSELSLMQMIESANVLTRHTGLKQLLEAASDQNI
ncbi:MAG: ATP-binding domain-containing protein, partial [Clostridia bacterium]|nr:ATP-binding domain-containing protein [Clostridia bacterium]